MGHLITVAACALRQWVLDYEGNTARIIESIKQAKGKGASIRVGSELEICGYECLDHFLEQDLYFHCWCMLERILSDGTLYDILLDIGMPVQHRNVRYNCRIICLNGKILFIRPKMSLAGDGNYFETRHFTPWMRPRQHEEYHLPRRIRKIQGATHVPFGDAVISTPDTCIGVETCEELFTPDAPHTQMGLDGVEIFTNSSGSHFTLRKLDLRMSLIQEGTRKNGGVYIYSNQSGCGGNRLYFDASAMILVNGDIVAQGNQFSLDDVEVIVATVDLEEVRAYRSAVSRGLQAAKSESKYERIQTSFALSSDADDLKINRGPNPPIQPRMHSPEEEIALAAGCYLWDYLRRAKAAGFILALSGGIDSCASAVLVFSMCRLVVRAMKAGNEQVIADVKRLAKYSESLPETPQELCSQLMHTIYLGMSRQSSSETRKRAKLLSQAIGAYHVDLDIDSVYEAQRNLVVNALGFEPKFKVEGGTDAENLALQNIQSRSRMVTTYEFAQTIPRARHRPGGGSLLVLSSANVGESLRGYLTKYDCSSGDINVIGAVDKRDLKNLILWAEKEFDLPCLRGFATAIPTAELEPITDSYSQSDEADMGMSYDTLTVFGRLRKVQRLGAYGMFQRLVHEYSSDRPRAHDDNSPVLEPRQVAEQVKRFHKYYAINRHKMTTLTPSLHCNDYSPDDNRFDMRPYLYPPADDSWDFKKIDEELERIEEFSKK
ncbi:MAG: hypothetical protein Q9219_003090 [cf. Caloplaca sp. 3 TL-2023]